MNGRTAKILFWSPRITGVCFAVFTGLLALDVFVEDRGFGATAAALFVHLIPAGLVAAILVIAWRRDWFGAVMFPVLTVIYLALGWGKLPVLAYLAIPVPLALIGLFFLINGIFKSRSQAP